MKATEDFKQFKNLDEEQLPVAKHKLHDWTHFAGLYAAEHVATGGSIKFATLVIAAWCYYSDKGMDRHGRPIEVIDAMSTELHLAARETTTDPLALIRIEPLFGNLIKNERFTTLYATLVQEIYRDTNIKKHMIEMI